MDENLVAKRKRVVMDQLLKGKQIATRLQTLLHEPVQDNEPVSCEELAMQIVETFTTSLSELNYCSELHEFAAVGSTCSVESEKTSTRKDRRGCYKRRKTSVSWTKITQTIDDGLAWRKYGQKKILNSVHPRCYFRCTHKYQGCKATKQFQKLEEDPFMYQITYFNHHTCTGTLTGPHLNVDPDPMDSNLISFQTQTTSMNTNISPMKEESHISNPPTPDPIWQDILIGSDYRFGYQEVGSSFHQYESTSFLGHDMEVNQLDDIIIDNFQFD